MPSLKILYIYYLKEDLKLTIVLFLLKGYFIKFSQPKYLKEYSLPIVVYRLEIYIKEH